MKSRLLALIFLPFVLSCNDFLEEHPTTEIRPSTIRDMEKIIESNAYPDAGHGELINRGTDIFTDDVQSNIVDDPSMLTEKELDRYHFIWDVNMFEDGYGGLDVSYWEDPYERIKGCNIVIEYVDGMEGEEERKAHVKGEAYVLRGLYYYFLVNFFSWPYGDGDPTQNAGVPLKLATGVTDDHLERGTVAGVYDQIVSDMKQGIALMQVGVDYEPSDIERLNRVASWGLLSRVYLHMEDWESVINYADSVLTEYSSLQTLEPGEYGVYSPSGDLVEVLWASLEAEDDNMQTILSPYGPSEDLYNCFREDIKNNVGRDIRGVTSNDDYYRAAYIHENAADDDDDAPEGLYCVLKSVTSDNWYNAGIRTAEVYLNRAEAYIRLYMEDGDETKAQRALDDLNDLRRTRFENGYEDWLVSDFETPEELLDFCLRERRRELCAEANTRWFDLRRTGMPRIVHTYVDNSSGVGQDYILEERDTRYVLPIPGSVAERNPNLRK